jgi:hypothetical protein
VNQLEVGLPVVLQHGLDALRSGVCREASVMAVDGNFVLFDLGTGALPASYSEREARVFARVSLDFLNAEPYGVITIPFLHRVDGKPIPNQHAGHESARPVDPTGTASGFWSWNWTSMPRRRAEDVAAVYEWAWKCLRDGGA